MEKRYKIVKHTAYENQTEKNKAIAFAAIQLFSTVAAAFSFYKALNTPITEIGNMVYSGLYGGAIGASFINLVKLIDVIQGKIQQNKRSNNYRGGK